MSCGNFVCITRSFNGVARNPDNEIILFSLCTRFVAVHVMSSEVKCESCALLLHIYVVLLFAAFANFVEYLEHGHSLV